MDVSNKSYHGKLENISNNKNEKRIYWNLSHAAEAAQQTLMFFSALQWRTKVQNHCQP